MSQFRVLTHEDHTGQRVEFAAIQVAARLNGQFVPIEIDQKTGYLSGIPESYLWGRIENAKQAQNDSGLVRQFQISVFTVMGQPVVVAQRLGRANTYSGAHNRSPVPGKELLQHTLPPTKVSFDAEASGKPQVWTRPMNRDASNRVELWTLDSDGHGGLWCAYLITRDDGDTWQLAIQKRYEMNVFLRKEGTMFELPAGLNDRDIAFYNANPVVQELLQKYVFAPGDYSEHFAKRMQILGNPEFRKLLEGCVDLKTWEEPEDFWVKPPILTDLKPNQGVAAFHTYGVGRNSFGIIELQKPVFFRGKERYSIQFDETAVSGEGNWDAQGILEIFPGTIVEFDPGLINMDSEKDGLRHNPPKTNSVVPIYDPMPIVPAKVAEPA